MRKAFGQNKKNKINNAKHDYINCTMWQTIQTEKIANGFTSLQTSV